MLRFVPPLTRRATGGGGLRCGSSRLSRGGLRGAEGRAVWRVAPPVENVLKAQIEFGVFRVLRLSRDQ